MSTAVFGSYSGPYCQSFGSFRFRLVLWVINGAGVRFFPMAVNVLYIWILIRRMQKKVILTFLDYAVSNGVTRLHRSLCAFGPVLYICGRIHVFDGWYIVDNSNRNEHGTNKRKFHVDDKWYRFKRLLRPPFYTTGWICIHVGMDTPVYACIC